MSSDGPPPEVVEKIRKKFEGGEPTIHEEKAQATQSSSASTTESAPFESKQLGEYTTQAVIGRGGYGVVFKAQHGMDKRWYAIKRVYVDDTEQSRNKVLREVRLMAPLDHPHIIRYYDAWLEKPPLSEELSSMGSNQSCLYIRMELCCDQTLRTWLRQNRLPEQRPISQTLDWFRQLVSAVKYIHDKGLIHGDIKPQNIFFGSSRDGAASVLKIGDFGLAIDVAPSSSSGVSEGVSQSLSIVGTPSYMSPEQESGDYKNSTDIFSLGLVFLEMVHPFKRDGERRSAFGALRANQRPAVMDKLDENMDALISRMTAFEPKKRTTSSELDSELKKMTVEQLSEPAKEIGVGPHAEANDSTDSNVKSEVGTSSTHLNERVRDNEGTADLPVSETKVQGTQSTSTSTTKSVPSESKQLDEYTARTEIGRGRFGVVFKARHKTDKGWYAIKQVGPVDAIDAVDPVDVADTEQSRDKVLREVHILAKLDHPHIIRYYDAWLEKPPLSEELSSMGSNQPYLYIRMELCCDQTLHEWLEQNQLPEQRPISQTLDWFSQLVSAVKYIHDKGLIHRDIKPGGIFFGSSRNEAAPALKIGDFGLGIDVVPSSSSEISGDVSASLSIAGTYRYMSPEQSSGHYTNSTDIYSLGLVFLEMVHPFKTDMERCGAFGALRANQRPAVMDKLDKKTNELISWMTAFRPKKRPTASELNNELKKKTVEQLSEPAKEMGVGPHAETNDSTDSNIKSEVSTSATHLNERVRDNEGTADLPVSETKVQGTQSTSTSTTKSVPSESKQLDEYTARTEIGRGRFGVVFKARHKTGRGWYAIKRVYVDDTEQSYNEALREVRALAELNHLHIVRYYDAWLEKPPLGEKLHWMDDDLPCLYIRMELCCDQTLRTWLRQNRLPTEGPIPETRDWFRQLVLAVKYIHNKGLIHRDINAENIFVRSSRDGAAPVLRIGGFGLATYAATSSSSGTCFSIVGTEMYMSPEQPSGHYTNSTDIFSLGLVFLEIECPPKDVWERYVVFGAFRLKQRPAVMDELDGVMDALISWMTAFEPEKRANSDQLAAAPILRYSP